MIVKIQHREKKRTSLAMSASAGMTNNCGFTLIEILVVILIISIIAGVAVISVKNHTHKQSAMQTEQLVNEIKLAEQESLLRPATLGLQIYPDGWEFKIYVNADGTHPATWQPFFKKHVLPSPIHLSIEHNDQTPTIIISPGGDLTPFKILIGKNVQQADYEIIGQANGEVVYHELHS